LPFFLQNVFLYDNLHIPKYIYQLPFLISQMPKIYLRW
jgi:hypothetical protein